jgi:hypothetical protein
MQPFVTELNAINEYLLTPDPYIWGEMTKEEAEEEFLTGITKCGIESEWDTKSGEILTRIRELKEEEE